MDRGPSREKYDNCGEGIGIRSEREIEGQVGIERNWKSEAISINFILSFVFVLLPQLASTVCKD